MMVWTVVRGLVKLKKFQKSEKNSDCPDNKHPPACPFFYIFGNFYNEKNNTKNTILKKKSELGLEPPTHPRVFLGFHGPPK